MEYRKECARLDLVSENYIRQLSFVPSKLLESAKIAWLIDLADRDPDRFQRLIEMLNAEERDALQTRLCSSLEDSKNRSTENA